MRKKELKAVVAFHTTAEAIKFEKACKREKVKGRLITVPREISAGCGFAWCSDLELKEKLREVCKMENIDSELYEIYR